MSQPSPYDLTYDFVGFQVINPDRPLPANKLEAEFNAVKHTLDQILANLALIQRDDTQLANATVGYDQFKPGLDLGFNPPNAWATLQPYSLRDTVFVDADFYRCTVAHTSGNFATDLANGKWVHVADFSTGSGGGGASELDDLTDVSIAAPSTGHVLRYNGSAWVNAALAQSDIAGLAAALAALQPLDSDLTAIAGLSTVAYGRSLLTLANATALAAEVDSFFLTPSEGNAAYQPLDADLTAIAGITYAQGDILYHNGSALVKLAAGVNGQFLRTNGAGNNPGWADAPGSGGGISNIVEDTTPQLGGNLDLNGFTLGAATAADLTKLNALTATSTELNFVDGVTSAIQTQIDGKQPLDTTLAVLAAYNTNGLLTQTAADTFTGRTIVGTANQVTVNNGNGVSGNPTLSLPQDIATTSSPQFAGINVGNASDTTITRGGAGDIAVEGNVVYRAGGTDVPVVDGGTGVSSLTPYAVLCGGLTTTGAIQALAALGTAGQVLTSNGAAALPSFQNATGGGMAEVAIQTFTASGSYTKSGDLLYAIVITTGAGGGGGGADASAAASNGRAAAGGAGGATCIELFAASALASSETVTIGTGGTAGTTSGGNGGAGGNCSFGSLHTANGGSGGTGTGNGANGAFSAKGPAGATATGGTLNITGGDGGSSVGVFGAQSATGGQGGGSFWGSGGAAGAVDATGSDAGLAGGPYGSGGGGAANTNSTTGAAGGAGAGGVCIVIEFKS